MFRHADRLQLEHRFFILTILAKGSLGVLQRATAASVYLGVTDRLPAIAQWLVRNELAEDPNDFIAARLVSLAGLIPQTNLGFHTAYFTLHGLLHVGVVVALLVGAGWAYPGAIAMLSLIDIVVIVLTMREWQQRRLR